MTPDRSSDPSTDPRTQGREAAALEIKQAAREHLLRYGADELSLRAVARDVGMTPSALYRYFESRGALVAALSADALQSAVDALDLAADDRQPPVQQLRAMFTALRGWAQTHRSEFELVFANRDDQTRPDVLRSRELQQLMALPLTAAMAAIADASLPVSAGVPTLSAAAREAVTELPDDVDLDLLARAVLVCTRCVGWLYVEHFGMVAWAVDDSDAAYATYLDGLLGPTD